MINNNFHFTYSNIIITVIFLQFCFETIHVKVFRLKASSLNTRLANVHLQIIINCYSFVHMDKRFDF